MPTATLTHPSEPTAVHVEPVVSPVDTPSTPTTAPTPGEVFEALQRLGDTPDDIAETLHTAGVKGNRGNPYRCPLAMYLKRAFPGVILSVGSAVHLYRSRYGHPTIVPMPDVASQFLFRFDVNAYPHLVLTESLCGND